MNEQTELSNERFAQIKERWLIRADKLKGQAHALVSVEFAREDVLPLLAEVSRLRAIVEKRPSSLARETEAFLQ